MTTLIEDEQAQIIRELMERIDAQAKTIRTLTDINEELDKQISILTANETYLEMRLQLEKAGRS